MSHRNPADADTIAAIATPPGRGAIGIVRVSGPGACAIADGLFVPGGGSRLADRPSHTLVHGHLVDNEVVLDEVVAGLMRAPHSFTGEDTVELYCHGSPVVLQAVMDALQRRGARAAAAGEFTRRAFVNGRIDLTQAEAVADVIAAPAEQSRRAAVRQLDGALRRRLDNVSEQLTDVKARLEASIDFAGDTESEISVDDVAARIAEAGRQCRALLRTARTGRMVHGGCRVALAGRPNVGKSSLLNLLAREERALVTAIPGTTRDTLDVDVSIRGYPVRFVDTAGLRRARGQIERAGIARAEQALADADIVCWVADRSRRPGRGEIDHMLALAGEYAIIVVFNKSDLPSAWNTAQRERVRSAVRTVTLSARTGAGLAALEEALHMAITSGDVHMEDDVIIVRARQRQLLERAVTALDRAEAQLRGEGLPELLSADVDAALEACGELTGTVSSEDILDRIFAEFCVGK